MLQRSSRAGSHVLCLFLLALGLLRYRQWAAFVSAETYSRCSVRSVDAPGGPDVSKCSRTQSTPLLHGPGEALSLRRYPAGKRSSSVCTRSGFYRAVADFFRGFRRTAERLDAVLEQTPFRKRAEWSEINKEAYDAVLSSGDAEAMEDFLYEFLHAALRDRPSVSETRLEALAIELLEADAQWEDMLRSLKKLVPISGLWASLSEAGYASIAALKSDLEMRRFIMGMASAMRLEIIDRTSNGLGRFVPLHSGTTSTKSFAVLRQELSDEAAIGKWLRVEPSSQIAVEEVHLTSGAAPFPGACRRCEGRGFVHDASMRHDKAATERCFFCKDCIACGGSGLAPGPACPACQGRGFIHESGLEHDKPENVRCFFCSDCKECKGLGHLVPSSELT